MSCKLFLLAIVALGAADAYFFGAQKKEFRPVFRAGRIVGGEEAEPNSIPYQVMLLSEVGGNTYLCGASVMDANNVITAAHCINASPSRTTAVAGEHDWSVTDGPEQFRKAAKIIVHPDYDENTLNNDVAIIHLEEPLELNENVQPIELPEQDEVFEDNSQAVISGWGRLSFDGYNPEKLHVNYDAIKRNSQECSDEVEDDFGATVDMSNKLCVGPPGNGVCFGDSGGPMAIDGKLAGIASFVISGDCSVKYAGFFARTASFTDWFYDNMQK